MQNAERCGWAKDELDILYHDTEWGRPTRQDAKLFEFLILEGMQAGLSWNLILHRREHMRKVFSGFDAEKVAQYDDAKKAELLQDPGIIRNRLKVNALVENAKNFLKVQQEFGSFSSYIWRFVDGKPIQNTWATLADVPATTPESDAMSKDLKKRGFKFVGSTICYGFMQAMGLVNDHVASCPQHKECANEK